MDDSTTAGALYRKLLALYPRTFREQFGESMQQTFRDLYCEHKRLKAPGFGRFLLWLFLETAVGALKENVLSIKEMTPMKAILTNPRSSALAGFILALPFVAILSLALLGIDPPLIPRPAPDRPDVLGSLIVLVAFLLLLVGFFVARAPIAQAMRAGGSLLTHPTNLFLAAVLLFVIIAVVALIVADQYPCWIGVPNCD